MSEEKTIKIEKGAVTFLDVLGWKGIWEKNKDAIGDLKNFILVMKEYADRLSNQYVEKFQELRGKDEIIKILSISDTIAIFTSASPKIAIGIHAELCSWALKYSIGKGLPLRGAISYGAYSISDNIMLGYAVDEAASWHETTDWIGVILTPSAQMCFRDEESNHVIKYNKIPFKRNMRTLNLCVKWEFGDEESLYDIIQKKGPHIPEIAPKYLNTLEFLNRERDI